MAVVSQVHFAPGSRPQLPHYPGNHCPPRSRDQAVGPALARRAGVAPLARLRHSLSRHERVLAVDGRRHVRLRLALLDDLQSGPRPWERRSAKAKSRRSRSSTRATPRRLRLPTPARKSDEARRVLKAYPVFNADQVEGLPERFHPAVALDLVEPEGREAELDAFFAGIPVNLRHQGGEAYYEPSPTA
jgi:antirestriction protein ArdC